MVPQVGVLADLCLPAPRAAQVSEYRDLWQQITFLFRGYLRGWLWIALLRRWRLLVRRCRADRDLPGLQIVYRGISWIGYVNAIRRSLDRKSVV